MKLQLALDTVNMNEALQILERIANFIDIVEIGTPLIIEYGMEPVYKVKSKFPHLIVLADTKIMDAGAHEARIAFDAGADLITVLGITHNRTVLGAVESARIYNREVLLDMMCVNDIGNRAKELVELGARYICVHTAIDMQESENPYNDLIEVHKFIRSDHLAVAGGININNISKFILYKPEIIIVGSGITGQNDIVKAALAIRKTINLNVDSILTVVN